MHLLLIVHAPHVEVSIVFIHMCVKQLQRYKIGQFLMHAILIFVMQRCFYQYINYKKIIEMLPEKGYDYALL